jgi:hypothetical protein
MSASEAHAAPKRAAECGLVDETTRKAKRSALLEFVVHGLRYVFPRCPVLHRSRQPLTRSATPPAPTP